MGLLSLGTPLRWEDVEKHVDYVREHGVLQLLESFRQHMNRRHDPMLWGDELEYMVVNLDTTKKHASLSLRQEEILDTLIQADLKKENVIYHQEYGRYMLEATPERPYGFTLPDLLDVEQNMWMRRKVAKQHMLPHEWPLTISSFPRLGSDTKFAEPSEEAGGPATHSLFLPDNIINTHLRFPTLSANIRRRRTEKVAINVPLYRDTQTPWPFHDPRIPWNRTKWPEDSNARDGAALDNHIYMDAMGFGMGCCCVQVTMQADNVTEARNLYDQLAVICPFMMALSAASPFYRGYVSDQDTRWNVVSSSVDDRYPEERKQVPKSRYDSISTYIGTSPELASKLEYYNDIALPRNTVIAKQLEDSGMLDDLLVRHFSHLFIRDSLVVFEELLHQDDSKSMDHFENIQSTNWQTMRFKPPPLNQTEMGWRVEFRPMDVQVTDFENAAVCIFVVLLAKAVIKYTLSFYIPLSHVDENMRVAHKNDAVRNEKFWWRTDSGESTKILLKEIFVGSSGVTGLLEYVSRFLDESSIQPGVRTELDRYLQLIERRVTGELDTAAQWMRKFVLSHADYKHDSVIPDSVQFDLLTALERIMTGQDWETTGASMLGGCSPEDIASKS